MQLPPRDTYSDEIKQEIHIRVNGKFSQTTLTMKTANSKQLNLQYIVHKM